MSQELDSKKRSDWAFSPPSALKNLWTDEHSKQSANEKYNSKYLLRRLSLIGRSLPIPSLTINTILFQCCDINILDKSINRTDL